MIKPEEQQRKPSEKISRVSDQAEFEAALILQHKGEPMTFEDAFWKLIEKI